MVRIAKDITKLIGNTPLVWLNKINKLYDVKIAAKLEFFNPGSSVKDRIAFGMIRAAERSGDLKPGMTIVEPTSGNTGIGLALIAAAKGYKLILTMPETMSIERRKLLKHLGAEIVLTPAEKGMKGAIEEAKNILDTEPDAFMPQQFKNPANPQIHRETTAEEIWNDTEGNIDIFVAGVGTGGTITGTGEILKSHKPDLKIIAVEPANSDVLSGGNSGHHKIQGIGAGFIPDVLNPKIIDEVIRVEDDDALKMSRTLAKDEGILCGISSGAAVWASIEVAKKRENKEKLVVVIIPDTAERYLSTELFL
ncbi:MAG: cysteine synthase A [Spirochaetes bacterium]|nr:MAG: cysteine synthase A [Spirochaetota bacterium]